MPDDAANDHVPPPLIPWGQDLLPGFRRERVVVDGVGINVAVGGSGPPLLLLHGNPLTHVSWHKVAPSLAQGFTVVAPDLRGYGDSDKPDGGADHSGYSFRTMGNDNVAVMQHFGFDRFGVAGHDRGARVGFRMALDHPGKVSRLAALDIVPTHHVLSNVSLGWGLEAYHWFFMAQKAPFPEKLLCADLAYYISYKLKAMAEYVRCTTPEQIHAVCEDYRATVSVDFAMDSADFGKRHIACPVLVLWGSNSHCGRHFKVLEAWSPWAPDLRGWSVPTGHYPAEHRPDLVYDPFWRFFSGREPVPFRE
ncbi:MAG: alpha/beta hydrolase [Acetobacteraceae bacterium]|nr:alpha/beta hydrolase [Acetobacteraceae bacterium]